MKIMKHDGVCHVHVESTPYRAIALCGLQAWLPYSVPETIHKLRPDLDKLKGNIISGANRYSVSCLACLVSREPR